MRLVREAGGAIVRCSEESRASNATPMPCASAVPGGTFAVRLGGLCLSMVTPMVVTVPQDLVSVRRVPMGGSAPSGSSALPGQPSSFEVFIRPALQEGAGAHRATILEQPMAFVHLPSSMLPPFCSPAAPSRPPFRSWAAPSTTESRWPPLCLMLRWCGCDG